MAMTLDEQGRLQRRAIRIALAVPAFIAMLRAEAPPRRLTDQQRRVLREHEDEIRQELLTAYPVEQVNDALERVLRLDGAALVLKGMLAKAAEVLASARVKELGRQ